MQAFPVPECVMSRPLHRATLYSLNDDEGNENADNKADE